MTTLSTYKPKFYYLRKCAEILEKAKNNTEDLSAAANYVNQIYAIYQDIEELIKLMETRKEGELLQDSPNYYNLVNSVETAYFMAKRKYHDIHWDQKQFNAY